MRLGNSLLRFVEVVGQPVQPPIVKKISNVSDEQNFARRNSQRQRTIKKDLVCRVCLCDDFSRENPLIAPCSVPFRTRVHGHDEVHPPGLSEEVDPLQTDVRAQAAGGLNLLEELRVRALPGGLPEYPPY